MLKNYFKIAWRNLLKNKMYSVINIGGLALGLAVSLLIGVWVYDEVSFDHSFPKHDRIVQVLQHLDRNGVKETQPQNPYPLAEELRTNYADDFESITIANGTRNSLSMGDKEIEISYGTYFDPQVTDMFDFEMLAGSRKGLEETNSILLSQSTAKKLFGESDPIDKVLKIDKEQVVKVTGVYKDFPANSTFSRLEYCLPWELYMANTEWINEVADPWRPNFTLVYGVLAKNSDLDVVSNKIKDAKLRNVDAIRAKQKPELFLHPMDKWHLYEKFENGVNTGGAIEYVRLFGAIGLFVLILACINFMNLSTAQSEKRSKEVGVRKAMGSVKRQLIFQYLSESVLTSFLALTFALLIFIGTLSGFNEFANKAIAPDWTSPVFWIGIISFCTIVGLVAGSYPAFYLSSFKPTKVLKGTFKASKFTTGARKVLVVTQFVVSIALIIGTITISEQLKFAQERSLGYNQDQLVYFFNTNEIAQNRATIIQDLKNADFVENMSISTGPPTSFWNTNTGLDWEGKDPTQSVEVPTNGIGYDYGKTIGWEIVKGRDFSRDFATDSVAFVINEAAANMLGFDDPINKIIRWDSDKVKVIGVVKNMVVQSPFEPSKPAFYYLSEGSGAVVNARLSKNKTTEASLEGIRTVLAKYSPDSPIEFQFVDDEFSQKYLTVQRLKRLTNIFAFLAIFISCLGLFGLASFIAQQRSKEIGVRKVLGATLGNVWVLLSKDFIKLVVLAFFIAGPIAFYFMSSWLETFTFHTDMSWWIFAVSGLGAIVITVATVSYQTIHAALMNPVKSLKSD